MNTFHFQIITQEKTAYDDAVDTITIPTKEGEISVLSGHIPLVSVADEGELVIAKGSEKIYMAITGGFLEVTPEKAVLLTDSAERFSELDEQKAQDAREKAEKMMAEKLTEREMAEAAAMLQKNLLHLKIIRKRRTHKQI